MKLNAKIPEHFDVVTNIKKAVGNGAACVLILTLMSVRDMLPLGAGFTFGLLGGSINDIIGWLSNKEAILAHKTKDQSSEDSTETSASEEKDGE